MSKTSSDRPPRLPGPYSSRRLLWILWWLLVLGAAFVWMYFLRPAG